MKNSNIVSTGHFFKRGIGSPEYVVGEVQNLDAIVDADDRRSVVDDAVVEALKLGLDSVDRMDFGLFHRDLPHRSIRQIQRQGIRITRRLFIVNPDDLRLFVKEVNRDVGIVLENPRLSHVFERDAAGGKVGYRAIFKFNARVGNIGSGTDHSDATSADVDDG